MKCLKPICRFILPIAFLVVCMYFVYMLVPHSLSLAVSAIEIYPNVDVISTTLYTTLITINLSLIALSVTVYIFLMSALEQSEDYERKIVRQMRASCTRWLLCLTGVTGVCIILALIADNEINRNLWSGRVRGGIICVLFAAVIFWILYIAYVIRYDTMLVRRSQKNIKQMIEEMESKSVIKRKKRRCFILRDYQANW